MFKRKVIIDITLKVELFPKPMKIYKKKEENFIDSIYK